MMRFPNSWRGRVAAGLALVAVTACGAPHLDPNTRAVTFDARKSEGSAQGGAPATGATSAISAATKPALDAGATKTNDDSSSANPAPSSGKRHRCSRLPDPNATTTTDWLRLDLHYEHGKLSVRSVAKEQSPRPEATVRRLGRFSAELWIGCELIERVNFDFPLLGAEAAKGTPTDKHPPDFERNARFDTTIRIPSSERATRLEFHDRTRDEKDSLLLRREFPWKFEAPARATAPTLP